jgi:hypothetical protein
MRNEYVPLKPVRWWQFWNPMSGTPGGLIMGSIIILVVYLFYTLL